MLSLGNYDGGLYCSESFLHEGARTVEVSVNQNPTLVNLMWKHWCTPFDGRRFSIAYYTPIAFFHLRPFDHPVLQLEDSSELDWTIDAQVIGLTNPCSLSCPTYVKDRGLTSWTSVEAMVEFAKMVGVFVSPLNMPQQSRRNHRKLVDEARYMMCWLRLKDGTMLKECWKLARKSLTSRCLGTADV